MLKKTIDSYYKLINQKTWNKSDVQRMCTALNSLRFSKNEKRIYELSKWRELFDAKGLEYKLTPEHTKQGIEYLRNYSWTTKGVKRKGCQFGYRELAILNEFKRFAFVGFHEEYNRLGMVLYHIIYRVYAKNGAYFDYVPVHWGHPMVIA